jgi:transposase
MRKQRLRSTPSARNAVGVDVGVDRVVAVVAAPVVVVRVHLTRPLLLRLPLLLKRHQPQHLKRRRATPGPPEARADSTPEFAHRRSNNELE